MMSPQLAAGLTGFVGLCMLAGWLSAFRNRFYLGWLGLAFLSLAGAIWGSGRAEAARALGGSDPRATLLAQVLFIVCVVAFLLALVSAVRETGRRVREIKERHAAAEEALLAMIRASRDREDKAGLAGDEEGPSNEDDSS